VYSRLILNSETKLRRSALDVNGGSNFRPLVGRISPVSGSATTKERGMRELSTTIAAATSHSTLCYPALLRSIPLHSHSIVQIDQKWYAGAAVAALAIFTGQQQALGPERYMQLGAFRQRRGNRQHAAARQLYLRHETAARSRAACDGCRVRRLCRP
jgi:hypothetical protein